MRRQFISRKKNAAVVLLSALTGGMVSTQALAQEASNDEPVYRFKMSIENRSVVPEWIVINYTYTPWVNDGAFGACTPWQPDPLTIDWGDNFQQSRVCQQPQVRTATPVLLNPVSKRTKTGESFTENQLIPVADYQNNIGQRDYITGERADDWPKWQDKNAPYECSVWSPPTSDVRLYDSFTQSRSCSQDQVRSRNVYNVWASGEETAKRVDNDAQTISVEQTQPAVGVRDEIDGVRLDTPTAWVNDGANYGCGEWTPLPTTQNSEYTQTRTCSRDQTRTQDHYDVWVSGKETLNKTETHEQTVTTTESRQVSVSWTNWVDQGDVTNCAVWGPEPGSRTSDYTQSRECDQAQVRNRVYTTGGQTLNTVEESKTVRVTQERVNAMGGVKEDAWGDWVDTAGIACGDWAEAPTTQTSDFTQSRDCGTAQKRDRDTFYTWAHSDDTFRSVETETRTDPSAQTRVVSVSWTNWTNDGAVLNCTAWGDAPTTQTISYTQSRECDQKQTRNRIYKTGSTTLNTVEEDKVIRVTQTRTNKMEGIVYGNWSAYADNAAIQCGDYSPVPAAQTADFTQSRDCTQSQDRTRDTYYSWTYGDNTFRSTETSDRTVPSTQTRTVTVGASDWSMTDNHTFGAYTPEPGTRAASYTQSRPYKQDQARTWTYTADGSELHSRNETRTVDKTQTRTNTMEGLEYSGWSAFTNTGTKDCEAWSPVPGSQTADYTQSRTCGTPQEQTRNVYYTWTHSAKTFKETETNSRIHGTTETRAVTVDYTNWTNNGDVNSCTAWSPAPGTRTASYTQTRSCTQPQLRYRDYYVGGTRVERKSETQDITVTQTRTNTMEGIAYGAWSGYSNNGNLSCGTYAPAASGQTADFTQSRDCEQPQKRTRATYYTWTYGANTYRNTETSTRDVASTQTRNVDVAAGSWSATGNHSFTAWGPEPGTRTASYTQSRAYKQNQARTWTYTADGSELHSRVQTQTVDKTQTRTNTMDGLAYGAWSGYSNVESKACDSYSPVPSTQTASYTQTRRCSTGQEREREVYYTWAYSGNTLKGIESDPRDYVTEESRTVTVSWTGWSNNGSVNSCTAWSPSPGSRTSSYTQSRTCTQPQLRYRDYYVGSTRIARKNETRDIDVTQTRTNKMEGIAYGAWSGYSNNGSLSCGAYTPSAGGQTADFTQSRACEQPQKRTRATYYTWTYGANTYRNTETGTRDVDSTQTRNVDVAAGNWSATGNHSFTAWSPEPGSRTSSYTQSRTYKQNQKRTWTYTADGSELHSRDETRTIDRNQTRTNTMDGLAYGSWSGYSNTASTSCGSYSPSPSTQTATFTQSRSCSTPQERQRDVFYTWAYSNNTFKEVEKSTRDYASSDSRSVTVSWTGWANNGSVNSCTAWSPAPGSNTTSYTQSRTCTQPQLRYRDYYVGSTRIARKSETRNIDVTQTRTNKMEGIAYGAWSGYSNNGNLSCGSYSPSPSTQTADFTQSRSCSQPQKRTRATYYTWTYGSNTYRNTQTDTRSVDSTQSRTVDVTATNWGYVRNHTFSSWSPEPGSRTASYTQSRTYKQDQKRTWTYAAGGSQLHTRDESRTINKSQNRTNTMNGLAYGSWSGYTNTASTSCGSYTPSPSTQTATFTQSRSCSTPQERQRDVFYTWAYSNNTFKEVEKGTRNYASSDSRSVTVSWTGWANNGSVNSCSGWSPAPGSRTTSYTQTRTCTQPQLRYRDYYVGSTRIARKSETRDTSVTQSRTNQMKGIVYGSWSGYSNNGSLSCGEYSPAAGTQTADFTQSRSCSQPQKRTRATYYSWTYGSNTYRNTETGTRNVASTQSRNIDVSVTGWSSVRTHSFGSWSPSYGSQTSSYTQTRGYKRDQKRTWSYNAGSNTLTTRDQTRTIDQTQSRTVGVTWSGWSDSGSRSCGAWQDYTSSQQRRSCTQPQTGTYTHKVGSTTVHTRSVSSSRSYYDYRDIVAVGQSSSYSAWAYVSQSCTSWTPSQANYYTFQNVNQSRTCDKKYKRTKTVTTTYNTGATSDTSTTEYKTVRDDQTRTVKGTKVDEIVRSELRPDPSSTSYTREDRVVIYRNGTTYSITDYCRIYTRSSYEASAEYRQTETTTTPYYYWDIYASDKEVKRSSVHHYDIDTFTPPFWAVYDTVYGHCDGGSGEITIGGF